MTTDTTNAAVIDPFTGNDGERVTVVGQGLNRLGFSVVVVRWPDGHETTLAAKAVRMD